MTTPSSRTFPAIALAVAALALVTPSPRAQEAARERPPITPHAYPLDDEHYLHWALPPGQQSYGRIDGVALKRYVGEITAISRKSRDDGERLWGRISGTKYDQMAEDWIEAKFRQIGLQNVRRQYFDLPPQWFPTDWTLTASAGGKSIALKTARPAIESAATPAGGLDLDPVWVGLGTAADFAGRDVRGRAVFIYSIPTPGAINQSAAWTGAIREAETRGAAVVVLVLGAPGNISAQVWSKADKVPTFSVGMEDGSAVRELIERGGGARIHAALSVDMRPGLRDASVWGELPGSGDEDIVVMAHHDAYFEGALDNGSGIATMVGLAEYFAKVPREQRRRTLRFVSTSGHHNGSLGVKWMHDNRQTFLAKTALLLNCEHVSVTQTYYWGPNLRKSNTTDARRWWVYGSDRLADLALASYRTFGVAVYHEMEPNASGDMGQASMDAPSVQMIESPIFYHTDRDTMDVVPAYGIEAVARAYAHLIDGVNTLDRRDLVGTPPPARSTAQDR